MELTTGQLRAARALGCSFSPATDEQIRRFSAQRRVFRIDGAPFVATRDGGFFETWATLAALIENHRPSAAEQGAAEAEAGPEHGVPDVAESSPAPAKPEAARADEDRRGAPAAPRRPRAPRRKPAITDEPPTVGAAAEPSEAADMLAGAAAAQASGARARVVGRVRRAGQPPTPRWMVAGKMRRGRLK